MTRQHSRPPRFQAPSKRKVADFLLDWLGGAGAEASAALLALLIGLYAGNNLTSFFLFASASAPCGAWEGGASWMLVIRAYAAAFSKESPGLGG